MLKTRIRKWCLLLLLLGCCMGVQAQYSMGNTGLLNIPTADMQKAGTFMGGGNYLPNGMTPFNFNTGNYFVNITFLSFLELSYRCTLLKTTRYDGKKGYFQQDRSLAGQEEVPSAWKVDLMIYPDLFLENNTFDELYTYAINLNPAVEMALWKGGKMTAQVILPVATNLSGEMKRIRPGIIALSQDVRFRHNIFGKMTVGNFTNNRYGAQLEIKYRTNNGRWELGGTAGSTGFSAITREDGWYIGRKQRINASLNASYYEPRLNLQFDLKAGRYIYGDYGVRGDCTRHFGEYAIGLYALCTDGEINGGFHFAIPLPGKKWSRKGFFRVKPADYFAWAYGMVADGEYIEKQLGKSYSTRPNENRSSNFYQPDYIRYFLIKEQQKEKSE